MTVNTTVELSVGIEGQGYFRVLVDPATTMEDLLLSRQFIEYLNGNSLPPSLVHRLAPITPDGRRVEQSASVSSLGLQSGATIIFVPMAAEVQWPPFADRPESVVIAPEYLQRILAVLQEAAAAVRATLPADPQPMTPNVLEHTNGFEGVSCSLSDYPEVNQPPKMMSAFADYCQTTAPDAVRRMSPDISEAFDSFIDAAATMLANINGRATNLQIEPQMLDIMRKITEMPDKISHVNALNDVLAPFKEQIETRLPRITALRTEYETAMHQGATDIWDKVDAFSTELHGMMAVCNERSAKIAEHLAEFDGFQDPSGEYRAFCDSIEQQLTALKTSIATCNDLIDTLRRNAAAHTAAIQRSCDALTRKSDAAQARNNFELERQASFIEQMTLLFNQYLTSAAYAERCTTKVRQALAEKTAIEEHGAEVQRNISTMIGTLSGKIADDTLLSTNLAFVHEAAKNTTDHFAAVTHERDAAVKEAVIDNASTYCQYSSEAFRLATTAFRSSTQEEKRYGTKRIKLDNHRNLCRLRQDFHGLTQYNQRIADLELQAAPCLERIQRFSQLRDTLNSAWAQAMSTAQLAACTKLWCDAPCNTSVPAADDGDAQLSITTGSGTTFHFVHPMVIIRDEDRIRDEALEEMKRKHEAQAQMKREQQFLLESYESD